jgi:hypothetical protein
MQMTVFDRMHWYACWLLLSWNVLVTSSVSWIQTRTERSPRQQLTVPLTGDLHLDTDSIDLELLVFLFHVIKNVFFLKVLLTGLDYKKQQAVKILYIVFLLCLLIVHVYISQSKESRSLLSGIPEKVDITQTRRWCTLMRTSTSKTNTFLRQSYSPT